MFVGILGEKINAEAVFSLQNSQYQDHLLLTDTVPAGQSSLGKVGVGNIGHFYCLRITGHFETLTAGPPIADDGISHLRGKMIDGANQRPLFNDYVPLDIILTPGREKSPHDPAAALGNNLFFPMSIEYLFTANSDILFDVKNDSDYELDYEILFWGIRVKSKVAVAGLSGR